jgi:hypothetical protein
MFTCLSWGPYGMGLLNLARSLCARFASTNKFSLMAESSIMAKNLATPQLPSCTALWMIVTRLEQLAMFCVTVIVCCLHPWDNLDLLRHVLQKLYHLPEVVLDNPTLGAGRSAYDGIPQSNVVQGQHEHATSDRYH